MKVVSKQDAAKRLQAAAGVAEIELKSATDVSKLTTDLKQQVPCVLLVCVK